MIRGNHSNHDEKLHLLHHDIKNCLHVISIGMEALNTVRDNESEYAELKNSIEKERREAVRLTDEMLKIACEECRK